MSLSERLDFWIERRPDSLAIVDDHRELDFAAFDRAVRSTANVLSEIGVGHGDRVASLATIRSDVFVTLFACARLGAALVPLNTRLAPAEIDWILDDCDVAAVVGDDELVDRVAHRSEPRRSFDEITAAATPSSTDAASTTPASSSDDLLIVYTSGTTGKPKGAVLTQSAVLANAENGLSAYDLTPEHSTLVSIPLFHVGGLNITATPTLLYGGTIRLHGSFDPGRWLRDVEQHRPTTSLLVPAMVGAVIAHPDFAVTDLSSLRYLAVGSSEVPVAYLRTFLDRGVAMGQVYGLTETGPIVVHQRAEETERHAGTVGRAARLSSVRILDADGLDVVDRQQGEIVARGPNLFDRYWNNPEATSDAFTDGWFHTGDMGFFDDAGQVTVCGRIKEMIISGGENIYPAEIEAVLMDDARISEVAVVGRPDERWGEVPVAVVVVGDGHRLTSDDIAMILDGRIARFKHPKDVRFVDVLPRNAMGKIQKFAVRSSIEADDRQVR